MAEPKPKRDPKFMTDTLIEALQESATDAQTKRLCWNVLQARRIAIERKASMDNAVAELKSLKDRLHVEAHPLQGPALVSTPTKQQMGAMLERYRHWILPEKFEELVKRFAGNET